MLINCVVYQNGVRIAEIQSNEIHEYIGRPDCFVWVALQEPDISTLDQMQEEFGLHDLAIEDAHQAHQRLQQPRAEPDACGQRALHHHRE